MADYRVTLTADVEAEADTLDAYVAGMLAVLGDGWVVNVEPVSASLADDEIVVPWVEGPGGLHPAES